MYWLRRVPIIPRDELPPAPWPAYTRETPAALRTVPGIWREPAAEEAAFAEEPLHGISMIYPKAIDFLLRTGWSFLLPSAPRLLRSISGTSGVAARQPVMPPPPSADTMALTEEVREEAARLGIHAVGFAPFDPKYMFKEFEDRGYDQGTVIVAIVEQSWELTQRIPSTASERHTMRIYKEMTDRTSALAEFLHAKGFRAQPHPYAGHGVVIHYAVEAGLGQLGLNGQLLTPQAGSRCRLALITTNTQLVHGQPVDYGIHTICDECQLCIKRCPPGAIPNSRKEHRGIVKAKIKTARCLPVMAQSHGCGVCMKVCPVQRYGLKAVIDHREATGEILGKGTDELEGYHWIDGKHYGPGEKPRITAKFVRYGELDIDPHRIRPETGTVLNRIDYPDVQVP